MKVYIIRHGESENNRKGLLTGWSNARLTERGREDAKRAGAFLKGISFDKIYTSDLDRAIETARCAIPECDYETSSLLREINVGALADQPRSILTDEMRARISKDGYVDFGGEAQAEFRGRISEFMGKLASLDCQNVGVFSHAGWLRGMLDVIVGAYLPRKNIACNNCAVAIFEYTDGVWQLHSWINLS